MSSNWMIGLPWISGQERRTALQTGELRTARGPDLNVRQARGVLGDIQPLNAERGGGLVTEIRLRGERIGAGETGSELVQQRGAEEMGFIEGCALSSQCSVLDARDLGPKIELAGGE